MIGQGLNISRACVHGGISRRSYYYEPYKTPYKADEKLADEIHDICLERPLYGYKRVTAVLRRRGCIVNKKRIYNIMKTKQMLHKTPLRRPHWQIHKGSQIPEQPDTYWQADMTKIWCGKDGWGYLFNVIDCCNREWVGYYFSLFCSAKEAIRALSMALSSRSPQTMRLEGLILHTDPGTQYTSVEFAKALKIAGIIHRLSRKHTPEDNGVVESFHKTLKSEYIWPQNIASFDQAEQIVVAAFHDYNNERIHAKLGYKTPIEYLAEVRSKGLNILSPITVQK